MSFAKNLLSLRAMLRVHFVRHAESEMNMATDIVCGRPNGTPLTERGRAQAEAVVPTLLSNADVWPIIGIISSPAIRTLATAAPLGRLLGLEDKIVVEPLLQELDQGSNTG